MTDPVRPVAPRDYVWLLNEAKSRVRRSVLWKRFIDGTPLENDIAVWMADLASEAATDSVKQHAEAVGRFLNDLYATMIDPCAEGTISVEEMCQQLLRQAERDRESLRELHERDTAAAAPVPCAASPADLIAKWERCADALSPENQRATGTVHEQCYRSESRAYRRCAEELKAAIVPAHPFAGQHRTAWAKWRIALDAPAPTGEGARDEEGHESQSDRHHEGSVGVSRPTDVATVDGERRARQSDAGKGRGVGAATDADPQASPVAVSLDPHRLQHELLEALKSEGQKDVWIEMLSGALRNVAIGCCELPEDWEGSVADALDLIQQRLTRDDLELARLRGEATVRVEE